MNRRETLTKLGRWSAVILGSAASSPLGACLYADYTDYTDYTDYNDYADIYCDCEADYWSQVFYCDYADYTDGCYADVYCDCGADFWASVCKAASC